MLPLDFDPNVRRLFDKFAMGDGCWEWLACKDHDGYGDFYLGGGHKDRRHARAHRVVYELVAGPIPDGLTLDHLCVNPGCVRPDHLEPVTASDNLRRRHQRARMAA